MKKLSLHSPPTIKDLKKVAYLRQHYDLSLASAVIQEGKSLSLPPPNFLETKRSIATSVQLKLLLKRNVTQLKRDPKVMRMKIGQTLLFGLLMLAVFFNLSGDSYVNIMGIIGFLFFVCVNQMFQYLMGTLLVFQEERPVFLREQANKMYGVNSYFLTKMVMEFPILVVVPLLFSIIVYFGVGLALSAHQFFLFYFIILMLGFAASGIGYFLSSIFQHEETAMMVTPVIVMPMILFGGFFANSGTYPGWVTWIQYLSPIRYCLEAFVQNEFGH